MTSIVRRSVLVMVSHSEFLLKNRFTWQVLQLVFKSKLSPFLFLRLLLPGQLLGICIKLSLAKYEVLPKLWTLDSRIRESRNHCRFVIHVFKHFLLKSALSWMKNTLASEWSLISARKFEYRDEGRETFVDYRGDQWNSSENVKAWKLPYWSYSTRHGVNVY